MLSTELVLEGTHLVVGGQRALEELTLQVAESELGLIGGSVWRLASILASVPAQLLEEGPGVDHLIVVLAVDAAIGRSTGVSEESRTLLLSLIQA